MPMTVRVGDTVNLQLANGDVTTAEITAVTSQDDIDVVYYNPERTVLTNAVRAASLPASVNEFWKFA